MEKHNEKVVRVAAVLLYRGQRLLICRRKMFGSCGGLWEFPGGKVEANETWEACAVRECKEELDVTVALGEMVDQTTYAYPDKTVMLTFFCGEIVEGEPKNHVHLQLEWVLPEQLSNYAFCPADEGLVYRLIEGAQS